MRLAVVAGRAKIIRDQKAIDVAEASGGKFGPTPGHVYENWSAFRDWETSSELGPGEQFLPEKSDAPSPAPRQVFAIGLNYRAHQVEAGFPEPTEPVVFTKFASSITGPVANLTLFTDQVDWEAEAAIVIGTTAYKVSEKDAWSHVAGVTAAQDFSARDVQMRPAASPQFSLGKSFPGFTPLGPVLVTPEELDNRDDIAVECVINGEVVQSSTTADLIFPVSALIAYLSSVLPLLPGDVILTGTPAGVGLGMTPPLYLKEGDEIITRVGDQTLRHSAIARPAHEQ